MREAGFKSIEIAKENGSWTALDSIENLEIPEDLKQGLNGQKDAIEYFEKLSKSAKKMLLYWVLSAKREKTRKRRIVEIVENASKQMKPKPYR